MLRRIVRVSAPLTLVLPALAALFGGCGGSDVTVAFADDLEPPSFTSPEAGVEPDADVTMGDLRLCPSNECPAGKVTCPSGRFPCSVDLSSDDENCGACGVRCANDDAFASRFHGIMRCVEGSCQIVCAQPYQDCNGLVEDGCEAKLDADDIDNCGVCGNVCDDVCVNGSCGCPTGTTLCPDGRCHELDREDDNCGACGNVCPAPDRVYPPESRILLRCIAGQCNVPSCPNPIYSDCNHDLQFLPDGELVPGSDGCETYTLLDANNCGACGNKCGPGEDCIGAECKCRCGAVCDTSLNSDPNNCGTCGLVCPGASASTVLPSLGVDPAHGRRTCDRGVCDYGCSLNWANCDGDIGNGCETNLLSDPLNCGGCGIQCDAMQGQPCVDGRCLTKECEVIQ